MYYLQDTLEMTDLQGLVNHGSRFGPVISRWSWRYFAQPVHADIDNAHNHNYSLLLDEAHEKRNQDRAVPSCHGMIYRLNTHPRK